jgi:hypothetical protein
MESHRRSELRGDQTRGIRIPLVTIDQPDTLATLRQRAEPRQVILRHLRLENASIEEIYRQPMLDDGWVQLRIVQLPQVIVKGDLAPGIVEEQKIVRFDPLGDEGGGIVPGFLVGGGVVMGQRRAVDQHKTSENGQDQATESQLGWET